MFSIKHIPENEDNSIKQKFIIVLELIIGK